MKPQTLAAWHMTGRCGLPVVKVGQTVRYRVANLERRLAARTVGPRSAEGAGGDNA